jgi:hypothetical protein
VWEGKYDEYGQRREVYIPSRVRSRSSVYLAGFSFPKLTDSLILNEDNRNGTASHCDRDLPWHDRSRFCRPSACVFYSAKHNSPLSR